MEKIKLKLITVALVAILLNFLSPVTLAYYTALGASTHVVTSGSIRFLIHERTDQGNAFPEQGVYIVPGDVVSKQVRIESDCSHPFYLRVKLVSGVNSEVLSSSDCFKLNISPEYWEYHEGWYYFKGIVSPYETTPNVFSHVEIVGSKVDNAYLGKTLTLTVIAHAVQSENNPIRDGKTYTAMGWPADDTLSSDSPTVTAPQGEGDEA